VSANFIEVLNLTLRRKGRRLGPRRPWPRGTFLIPPSPSHNARGGGRGENFFAPREKEVDGDASKIGPFRKRFHRLEISSPLDKSLHFCISLLFHPLFRSLMRVSASPLVIHCGAIRGRNARRGAAIPQPDAEDLGKGELGLGRFQLRESINFPPLDDDSIGEK